MPTHLLCKRTSNSAFDSFRVPPPHRFQCGARSVFGKLYHEQRRLDTICLNLLLPFLTQLNQRLQKKDTIILKENLEVDEIPLDVLEQEAIASAKTAACAWAELLSKLGVQSLYISLLAKSRCAYADTIIFAWDVQPRMLVHYFGDVLEGVGLGRFRKWLGADMTIEDIKYFESYGSCASIAFEDGFLRSLIVGASDVTVMMIKSGFQNVMWHKFRKESASLAPESLHVGFIKSLARQLGMCLVRACGAGIGHLSVAYIQRHHSGGRCDTVLNKAGAAEFYGELIGGIVFTSVVVPRIQRWLILKGYIEQDPKKTTVVSSRTTAFEC